MRWRHRNTVEASSGVRSVVASFAAQALTQPVRADNETPEGTECLPTGTPAIAIARDRRSAAGPVTGGLAVVGPVSRDRPEDCSPDRFDSGYQPLWARFRIYVRTGSHKGLVHQLAADLRTCPPSDLVETECGEASQDPWISERKLAVERREWRDADN